jgi:arginyl-tRNA synthetase
MNISKEIKILIEGTLKGLYPDFQSFKKQAIEILVEIPKERVHGDYSTNVALALSKIRKKSPLEIANQIVEKINHSHILKNMRIEKVEVVAP